MRFKLLTSLIFALFTLAVFAQEETPVPINVGSIQGEISAENISDRYSITVIAGQQLTVTMAAADNSDLDSRLFLFDEANNLLTDNDDSAEAGERNARIVYTPTITGVYIIEATRFQQEEGNTSGAYQLTVSLGSNVNDPLSIPPSFAVPYQQMNYEETVTGDLSTTNPRQYFVIGARQGDFIRIELNTTAGDLDAIVQLLNPAGNTISSLSESSPERKVIFATILETGWYLISITQQNGTGSFSLLPSLVSNVELEENILAEGRFDASNNAHVFVVNATINERVFVNLALKEGQGIISNLSIEDLNGIILDDSQSSGTQSRVSITVPRSGPYIVRVSNTGTGQEGVFQLQLRRTPVDVSKLSITNTEYNQEYFDYISENSPIRYYRFSGKAGELVTIRMEAEANRLDPYLILTDSSFKELIFSDNINASRNAQIAQFLLMEDGDYYILASRQGLASGTTLGSYSLEITVGELQLEVGRLSVSLEWQGSADLNLFVRTPEGRTVSWANPREPGGGILQIDSNTGCETLTDQPIEYIYWPASTDAGDYTIWVWYQTTCRNRVPVNFILTVKVDGEVILDRRSSPQNPLILEPFQRFESSIRITDEGAALVVNDGTISNPTPQQTESQGGDNLIDIAPQAGAINDIIFAQFYQFEGEAGETVRISVNRTTGDLDPILFLLDSLDNVLIENDDISESNNNSQIEYTLPETGRYVIVVSRYGLRDGTSLGDYQLSLERLETSE